MFLNLKSFLLTSIIFLGAFPASANLCDGRSQTVAIAIQDAAFKTCEQLAPEDLAKITELEVSSMSDPDTFTQILPGDFKGLTGLIKLSLDGSFKTIPSGVFSDLKNLQLLNIQDFDLQALPSDAFYGLSNLKVFELASPMISNFPQDVFAGLASLEELDMPISNDMSESLFHNLIHLKSLTIGAPETEEDIINAPISVDAFKNLNSLEELMIYQVSFPSLPTINHLKNLRSVELTEMGLTSMPSDFFANMDALESVSVSENDIKTVPVGYFSTNKNLKSLNLIETLVPKEEVSRIQSEYPNVKIEF